MYPHFCWVEPPTKFSKRGSLTGPQFVEEGCWERGGNLFQGGGGCSFYIKNKLKSETFHDKKVCKKNVSFCHDSDLKLRNLN